MGQKKEDIDRIAKYLLEATPSATSRKLYNQAISSYCRPLTPSEQKLWVFAMEHPSLLPYIDAGLGLEHKLGGIRERLYVGFAILETETAHAHKFIYTQKPFWILRCAFHVIRGIFRALIGKILLRLL